MVRDVLIALQARADTAGLIIWDVSVDSIDRTKDRTGRMRWRGLGLATGDAP